jgi:hypothetical protein
MPSKYNSPLPDEDFHLADGALSRAHDFAALSVSVPDSTLPPPSMGSYPPYDAGGIAFNGISVF